MMLSIILFVGTMVMSLAASFWVKSRYSKFAEVPTTSGLSGAEVADRILQSAGIHDVEIHCQDGMLSDHYDPIHKRLVLSTENYHGRSISAAAVSAHECGHAIQHKIAYAPLQWRMAAVGVTTFGNQIVTWLPLIGMFTGILSTYTGALLMVIGWGIIMVFNLITLPVEFDASRRAKLILGKMSFIRPGEEAIGVNKVLDAAALTYVAAFLTSLLYLLYHLLPLLLGRRDE